ncbi:MAG TPA: TadE family protein [Candidatus Limnocylindrales bacterium]|jgi:Flp pilus assembly protein TadG
MTRLQPAPTLEHRPSRIRREPSRGQALVEFALVAPIFFLLTFAIIELGILFGGQNGLVSAARELARYAAPYHVATGPNASNVCSTSATSHGLGTQLTESMQRAIPGYSAADVAVRHVTYHWLQNADGTYSVELTIHLGYRYPLYVPLVSNVLDGFDGVSDNALRLDATETMRIENDNSSMTTSYADVGCDV